MNSVAGYALCLPGRKGAPVCQKGQRSACRVRQRTADQRAGEHTYGQSEGTSIRSQEDIITRKFSLIAAAFFVANGLFGAWMLTSPKVSEAAPNVGINVSQLNAPVNLPSFDDTYQRHLGVLDTLRR